MSNLVAIRKFPEENDAPCRIASDSGMISFQIEGVLSGIETSRNLGASRFVVISTLPSIISMMEFLCSKESTRQKLENCWKKLSLEESKKLIQPKYEAAMLLLK